MKNENKIVELLSEMLQKQDAFIAGLNKVENRLERQENLLIKLLEIMDDDVPKFDQVIDIENLKDGSII